MRAQLRHRAAQLLHAARAALQHRGRGRLPLDPRDQAALEVGAQLLEPAAHLAAQLLGRALLRRLLGKGVRNEKGWRMGAVRHDKGV